MELNWISVKDKLPPEGEKVFIWWDGLTGYPDVAVLEGDEWINYNWHGDVKVDTNLISYWMPIFSPHG